MAPVSRMPEVVDAILARLAAAVPAGVAVWDGPIVTGDLRPAIHIGYDGDPAGEFEAGTSAQEWAGIGAKKRDETLTITGAVIAYQGGGVAMKEGRDAAYALLSLVGDCIHPLPSLGVQAPTWAGITSHALVYEPAENRGVEVRIEFEITVRTRP